jgi:L-amino acid N-acyltransferase YncA
MLLHVHVSADNVAAAELYRQLGFECYGIEPKALLVNGQFHDIRLLGRDVSKPGRDLACRGCVRSLSQRRRSQPFS